MKIYPATSEDAHFISKIWSECFTQDVSYINNFLNNCFPFSKTWLITQDDSNIAAASLSLLPCYVKYNGKIYKGGYVYAVGTLPEHRGNSYSKHLTEEAFRYALKEKLSFLAVKPATETLYELYSRLNFDTVLYEKISEIDTEKRYNYDSDGLLLNDRLPFTREFPFLNNQVNISKLYELREKDLSNKCILWDKEILSYAINEISFRNGKYDYFYYQGNPKDSFYTVYYPSEKDDSLVHVIDHNIKDGSTLEDFIFENSSRNNDVKNYLITNLPSNISKRCPVKIIKSGMVKSFVDDPDFNRFLSKLSLSLPME